MDRKLCTIDICGLDVEILLSDETEKLMLEERERNLDSGIELTVIESYGKYSVPECKIWIKDGMAIPMMQSQLFHEVSEFILGYFNVVYEHEEQHQSFMRLCNVQYGVYQKNSELLFGRELERLVDG